MLGSIPTLKKKLSFSRKIDPHAFDTLAQSAARYPNFFSLLKDAFFVQAGLIGALLYGTATAILLTAGIKSFK